MSTKRSWLALWMIVAGLLIPAHGFAQLPGQTDILTLRNWRTAPGDNPDWSNPAFDESRWEPSSGPYASDPLSPNGYSWYRTTVTLPPDLQGRELAIGFGPLNEVYEVYVEGVSVGRFGQWNPKPQSEFDRHLYFVIPVSLTHAPALHIALRRWTGPGYTDVFLFYTTGTNRFEHAVKLGLNSTIASNTALYQAKGIVLNLPANLTLLILLAAGSIAFVLFSAQPARKEYLYLGLYCVGFAVSVFLGGILASSETIMRRSPAPALAYLLFDGAFACIFLFLARICPSFRRWLQAGAIIVFLGYACSPYAIAMQSTIADRIFWTVGLWTPLLFYPIAAFGLIRERKPGSTWIAVALILRQVAELWYNFLSNWLDISAFRVLVVGPFTIDIRNIFDVFLVSVILTVLYLRFREEQRRTVSLEQDMASAHRMQLQLLSGTELDTSGFAIEAVYRPAKEVGGDFYRTELLEDGSLLVVIGDVSGKGLDAAMLVAAVLGGLAIDPERRPAVLLADLNKSVLGRTAGGFITASCARFYPNGQLVVANAGHIAPYLAGKELPVEAGLPLGILANIAYSESIFATGGATVTWLSDGVLEAQKPTGQLLGFERMAALTTQPAAAIANAAQQWGQEDDITVLTIRSLPLST